MNAPGGIDGWAFLECVSVLSMSGDSRFCSAWCVFWLAQCAARPALAGAGAFLFPIDWLLSPSAESFSCEKMRYSFF